MGYYRQFPDAIPHLGVRSIALLALSPLVPKHAFDLHVLAMPPAFNLSQDQTLQLMFRSAEPGLEGRASGLHRSKRSGNPVPARPRRSGGPRGRSGTPRSRAKEARGRANLRHGRAPLGTRTRRRCVLWSFGIDQFGSPARGRGSCHKGRSFTKMPDTHRCCDTVRGFDRRRPPSQGPGRETGVDAAHSRGGPNRSIAKVPRATRPLAASPVPDVDRGETRPLGLVPRRRPRHRTETSGGRQNRRGRV